MPLLFGIIQRCGWIEFGDVLTGSCPCGIPHSIVLMVFYLLFFELSDWKSKGFSHIIFLSHLLYLASCQKPERRELVFCMSPFLQMTVNFHWNLSLLLSLLSHQFLQVYPCLLCMGFIVILWRRARGHLTGSSSDLEIEPLSSKHAGFNFLNNH